MRVIARTIGAQTIAGNTDRVLAACPLPKGGRLLSVHGELHMIGEESQSTAQFMAYGIGGEMVPIVDPVTTITYQAIWDDVVVKSNDPSLAAATPRIDFDWITDDATPQLEPGEMDIDALLGLTQGQKEFLPPRIEWVSWAKSRQGGFAAGTPDTFLPSDFKTFSSKRRLIADVPSALMIAISSPLLDETEEVATHVPPSTAGEWYMLQNLRDTLRDMGKAQAGLIEAGAESPYADASTVIRDVVSKDMLDESTTLYNSMTWDALIVATWLLDFPGDSIPKSIDGR